MDCRPRGYATIVPYITVDDPDAAIAWYGTALGAEPVMRLTMGEAIAHAEIRIGDGHVMLAGEWPEMGRLGPKSLGGTTMSLTVYLPDVDAVFARAVEAGATPLSPPMDQFYGARSAMFMDPFGHRWSVHTHQRDVSIPDMQRALDQWAEQHAKTQGN